MTQRTRNDLKRYINDVNGKPVYADVVDSIIDSFPSHGSCYLTSPASTAIATPGTYYKASGTFTADPHSYLFDMPVSGRMRYTGRAPINAMVTISNSHTCVGNNDDLAFRCVLNSDPTAQEAVASTVVRRKGTGTDLATVTSVGFHMMQTNDYIELFVSNLTDSDAITIQYCNFCIVGFVLCNP